MNITRYIFLTAIVTSGYLVKAQSGDTCSINGLPSIPFQSGSVFLNSKAKLLLNAVAKPLINNSNCKVRIIAHINKPTYLAQQMSWDRMMSVFWYLKSKGIDEKRFIVEHSLQGNPLFTDIMAVNSEEEGPVSVPTPLPCLSYHRKINSGKRCVDSKGNFINN